MSHSKFFSPSGSNGWLNCAEYESNDHSSDAANYGTACHHLAEIILDDWKKGVERDFLATSIYVGIQEYIVDQEMLDIVEAYTFEIQAATGFDPMRLEVEQKVYFDKALNLPTQESGTADAVITCDTGIEVHDLKTGTSGKVYAENNRQLIIYAIGALGDLSKLHDNFNVKLVIHQPTLGHYDEWEINVKWLKEWVKVNTQKVQNRIAFSKGEPTEATPTEIGCQWCAKKATCKALYQYTLDAFEDESEDNIHTKYEKLPLIRSWIKAVEAKAYSLAEMGKLPGYKLVEGRKGHTKWIESELESIEKQSDYINYSLYDVVIKSPSKVKKELGTKFKKFEDYTTRSEGKPTIAKEDDKRPAITLIDDFD